MTSSSITTLDKVSWGDIVRVSIDDIGMDKFGGFYVRQSAIASTEQTPSSVIDITRTARGHVTFTDKHRILEMFGDNVVAISAPVDFNISTNWHKIVFGPKAKNK